MLVLAPVALIAEYAPREMCTIHWGDEQDKLKNTTPFIDGIISDTTDYYYEPGEGPSNIFVDNDENIIVLSISLSQLKVFSNSGELLYNLWPPEGILDSSIFRGTPQSLYVDTSGSIYLATNPPLNFIPVINYQGQIVNRLYPFDDTTYTVEGICWSTLKIPVFYSTGGYDATLLNGIVNSGGTCAFMGQDTCYYSCINDENMKLVFFRSHVTDIKNHSFTSDSTIVDFDTDSIYVASLIPGGDGSYLYVYLLRWSSQQQEIFYEIRIFDLQFKEVAFIELSHPVLPYKHTIKPFVAHDNSIYEFRCLDDGLHVIKWIKQ